MQLHILSGEIHSGKTTFLLNYIEHTKNCAGILSPVISDKRYFYCIESKETKLMQAEEFDKEILKIGKYRFSKDAFQWAIQKIEGSLNRKSELLIIDEIGPLELNGNGFSEIVKKILNKPSGVTNLLLVIRVNVLKEVLDYFNLNETRINYWKWK